MRRIELFFELLTAALTVWTIAAMLLVPVGVTTLTTLTTPTRTTTTYSYTLDQGIGPVIAYIALFSVLATLLVYAVIDHLRREPQARSAYVTILGLAYAASAVWLTFRIGGAAQPAGLAALLCAIVALLPVRRARHGMAT